MAKNESLELFHQQVTAIEGAIRQGTVFFLVRQKKKA